jgi:hypothetical protein
MCKEGILGLEKNNKKPMQIKQTVENRRSYKKIRHSSVGET